MAVLDDVKILLDIPEEETGLNNKLNLIIENAEKQVLSYLPSGTESVPTVLEYIVCEMAVARFNRIGNEGMSSYSQEGRALHMGMTYLLIFQRLRHGTICRRTTQKEGCGFYEIRDTGCFCKRE